MPDFSIEQWSNFKQQFMSVIRFIMYVFDMIFDACRSRPMLYAFLFFPIFAGAFLILFDLFTKGLPKVSGSVVTSKGSLAVQSLCASTKHMKMASVNLAAAGKNTELKSVNLGKLEKSNSKAQAKAEGRLSEGKSSGINSSGLSEKLFKGDTGITISGLFKGSFRRMNSRNKNKSKDDEMKRLKSIEQQYLSKLNSEKKEYENPFIQVHKDRKNIYPNKSAYLEIDID